MIGCRVLADGGIYHFKCMGAIEGNRWLDGRTNDGSVGLAPTTTGGYTGTSWQALEVTPTQPDSNPNGQEPLSVVGTWSWFNGHTVVFHQDGTIDCSYNGVIDNTGTWELTDASSRQYIIHWQVGGWIDQLTLSSDGNSLDGYNREGTHVTGTKNSM